MGSTSRSTQQRDWRSVFTGIGYVSNVVVEFPLPLPIRPVVTVATIEIRRAPNSILRDVGPEATKAGVVVQLVPRKGILLAAKAQEAAEG